MRAARKYNEYEKLARKRDKLKNKAISLGPYFHGSPEKTLPSIVNKGLKISYAKDAPFNKKLWFCNPHIAEEYGRGNNWRIVHQISNKEWLDKHKKQWIESGQVHDFYRVMWLKRGLPRKYIKTYMASTKGRLGDRVAIDIEKRIKTEGKTQEHPTRVNPSRLIQEINYYSAFLAEDAYEKHSAALRKATEKQLSKKGKVTFASMRDAAKKLGIIPEVRNDVIGSVFLDLGLVKKDKAFVRKLE